MKVNRYRRQEEQEKGGGSQDFSDMLNRQMMRKQSHPEPPKEEKLRLMGGLTQYNRHAVEFCFILSSEADYRA